MSDIRYRNAALPSGIIVKYAESGSKDSPVLLLLHGFPSSHHQYRNLIPLLAGKYRVIAPDLPGFGSTIVPENVTPSFDLMADTIIGLVDQLGCTSFAAYVFDYGAPTLFRLALKRPSLVKAIISQNGNAYDAGLGAHFWGPLQQWWAGGKEDAPIRGIIEGVIGDIEWTKAQYFDGVPDANRSLVDPSAYSLDFLESLSTDEKRDTQLKIFWDYQNNISMYPQFHAYFRESEVPLLAVWGKGDPCFIPPGAEGFKKDLPNAKVHFLDGGHFLLETHVREVAQLDDEFLGTIKW
jgi:pimeloyl-ACP methyl ester carboxylesterase